MHVVRRQLLDAAWYLTGAKVLAARLYGVGMFAALALNCWLDGEGWFYYSRKAVWFAGLDITVSSSDAKDHRAAVPARTDRHALGSV